MTEFRAGAAVGVYRLDISQAEQATQRLRALFAQIKAEAAGVGTNVPAGGGSNSIPNRTRELERLRDSEIRAARAAGEHQRALFLNNNQLRAAIPNTIRYNQLLAQQSQIQKQMLQPSLADQFGASLKSNFLGVIGPAALATAAIGGITAAITGGIAAGGEALAVREQQNSLRAVAGSMGLYAEAVRTAKDQQLLFGGSLRENLDGIQGLTIVSRESGASLKQLIDLTQRLQLKSPEQGVGGARIAITEALSGNITSLSRRFEIPKEALKGLSDTSLPVAERLALIDTYLAKIGITSESVAGRVDKDAAAFRRLNAELEQTKLRAGDELASAFGQSANGLARLIGLVNQNPQAIAELKALATRTVVTPQSVAESKVPGQLGLAPDPLKLFNPVTAGGEIGRIIGSAQDTNLQESARLLTQLNLIGGESAAKADEVTAAYRRREIGIEALVAKLRELRGNEQAGLDLHDRATAANKLVTNAIGEQALETLNANVEAERQKRVMASIALQAGLVQKGFITQAQGANILRGQLGAAADEAIRLQLELGRSAAISAQKTAPLSSAEKSFIDRANAGKPKDASARLLEERKLREAQEAYQKSLLQFQPVANQLAAKRAELSKIGQDDPRRFQVMTEIARLQNQLDNEKTRLAKSHTSELNKQLGLNESIYDSQQKQYRAALDLEELTIRNRQETRAEDDKIRRLNITANTASDPRIRAAAQDALALINVERRQRQAEIAEKQGISSAPIVNGRILESLRGGASRGSAPTPTGGVGVPGGAASGGSPSSSGLTIQFLVDGKLIAEVIEPQIIANALAGQRASAAGGGGLGAP